MSATKHAQASYSLAPDSLVFDVYDTLVKCSRKQQQQLLSVLLNASSEGVLELVRAEAVKIGAMVETKSRFQNCHRNLLDAFFSFLNPQDLRAVELVCGHWRIACIDGGAGWIHALSRPADPHEELVELSDSWAAEVARHRINPATMLQLHSAKVTTRAGSFVLRIPSIRRLDLTAASSNLIQLCASLQTVDTLCLGTGLGSLPTSSMLGATVTDLDATAGMEPMESYRDYLRKQLPKFPHLRKLSLPTVLVDTSSLVPIALHTLKLDVCFGTRREPDSTVAHCVAELTSLSTLKHLELFSRPPYNCVYYSYVAPQLFESLGQLTQLTSLRLPVAPVQVRASDEVSTVLDPLGSLTNLTRLDMLEISLVQPRLSGCADCRFLSLLTNLVELHGFPSIVDDESLAHLATLSQLRTLDLSAAGFSLSFKGLSFAKLCGLPLQSLNLANPRQWIMSDVATEVLRTGEPRFARPKTCGVTAQGLHALVSLPHLRWLKLSAREFAKELLLAADLAKLRASFDAAVAARSGGAS